MGKARKYGMNTRFIPNAKADQRYRRKIHEHGRKVAERRTIQGAYRTELAEEVMGIDLSEEEKVMAGFIESCNRFQQQAESCGVLIPVCVVEKMQAVFLELSTMDRDRLEIEEKYQKLQMENEIQQIRQLLWEELERSK